MIFKRGNVISHQLTQSKLFQSFSGFFIFNVHFSCLALSDLTGDGDFKLVVADLGSGNSNMKLRVYKGTQMVEYTWCRKKLFLAFPPEVFPPKRQREKVQKYFLSRNLWALNTS